MTAMRPPSRPPRAPSLLARARQIISSYWLIHAILGFICLLATIPILWPFLNEPHLYTLGYVIIGSLILSLTWLLLCLTIDALHLRNSELMTRLSLWLGIWAVYLGIFSLLSYIAHLPEPSPHKNHPLEQDRTVHLPQEKLMGSSNLHLYFTKETEGSVNSSTQSIADAPHLKKLAREHPQLLDSFLSQSGRWRHQMKDQFYGKLGHVVLTDSDDPTGENGSVHATFRRLAEGSSIPKGYTSCKMGDSFPSESVFKTYLIGEVPDIALDLGGSHILLLAWRGMPNVISARRALNAAIRAIDEQFEALATAPSEETLQQLLDPETKVLDNKAEIRLNSPPSQYGCYQAEVYSNSSQKGYLSLIVKDVETGKKLININFRSQYSYNEQEVFRHEIPHSLHSWMLKEEWMPGDSGILHSLPLFTIEQSETLRSFAVDLELWFSSYGNQSPAKLITRKRYRVQSYQPSPEESPPTHSLDSETPDTLPTQPTRKTP